MVDLTESRRKLDEIDKKIVELFENRMKISMDVAEYKMSIHKPIYDKEREKEKVKQVQELAHGEFNQQAVKELFLQIMSLSKQLQYQIIQKNNLSNDFVAIDRSDIKIDTNIVYYGEKGAYTEAAMLRYFGDEINSFAASSFRDVMQLVKDGEAIYGVLPIENTSTGSLSDIYDLLAEYDNHIIGEYVLPIEHMLLGLKDSTMDDIKVIYSHPQAIMQCSDFLKQYPSIKVLPGGSTAQSAKRIYEQNDSSCAAIASMRAAECYNLKILQDKLANQDCNATRFIIITNHKVFYPSATHTSICFALPHESGALFHTLSHFIHNNINMTKIESRPIEGKPFEYRFFVEVESKIDNVGLSNAIECIRQEALEVKIIGCYEIAR